MAGYLLRKASTLVARLQRLTRERSSFDGGNRGDKLFNLDIGLVSIGLVSVTYLGMHTFLLDLYTRYRFPKDARSITILQNEPRRLKPYLETIANANVTEAGKDLCSIRFVGSLEPEYIGSLQSHNGACFGLPRYYIDQQISRAELGELFDLDLDRLTPEAEDVLRWTMSLSFEAQRYGLLKCLHSSSIPLVPYGSVTLLVVLPGLVRRFTSRLTLPLHLSLIGASYILTNYLLDCFDNYHRRYGQWAVQHLESEVSQHGRQEFEQKRAALYQVVVDYSQKQRSLQKMFDTNKDGSLDWLHRLVYYFT